MYFEIEGTVYSGFEDDDRYDKKIMSLPDCYDFRFHSHCLLTMELFENDEGEERVAWTAYLLKGEGEREVVASVGDYAFCETGVAGAWEDAEREAIDLFERWEQGTT